MQSLLLSYYGDDLTGSTDVMEALELGGVPTVLFMRQPDEALLSRSGIAVPSAWPAPAAARRRSGWTCISSAPSPG